jgi:hypothetical protein
MLYHFKERLNALQTIEHDGGWDVTDDERQMRGKFPFQEQRAEAPSPFPTRFYEKTRYASLFLWLWDIQQCPKV